MQTRLIDGLRADGTLSEADVASGRTLVANLQAAFEVRSQWEPGRVAEWRKLVEAGLSPRAARAVVLDIHYLA
jgi:hypothetical protein